MNRPAILVSGSNGQLGKELKKRSASFPGFAFIFLSREDMPIHHFELVRNTFEIYHPKYFINCAAYTAVDRAEQEKDLAMQVNGEAPGVLAAICLQNNCHFLHISTDYVFDGASTNPYKEEDITNPQSVYGFSKLEGEKQALRFNPASIIIRTSWVYSEFGKNFVKTMLKLMSEREEISVVNDQKGSPTYAADLAEAIIQIISSGRWIPGIYHYSNDGVISWYDFAVAINEMTESKCKINPIPSSTYPTAAKRPSFSSLQHEKILEIYNIETRDWKKALEDCLAQIKR